MEISPSTGNAPSLLNSAVEHDRPVLVYCDDATGERTALSAAALSGWVNRTANLLTSYPGPGGLAAVLLPPHWQTAAIILGAWTAGLSVEFQGLATAGLPRVGPGADRPIDVSFVAGDQLFYAPRAPSGYLVRIGADERERPYGYLDYLDEVRGQDDVFQPAPGRVRSEAASPDGTSYAEWGSVARELAGMSNLEPGDRVLIDAAKHDHPLRWLLVPLSVGASIVLCANLDEDKLAERIDAEHVTRVL